MVFSEMLCKRVVMREVMVNVRSNRNNGFVRQPGVVSVEKIGEDKKEKEKVESGEVNFLPEKSEHTICYSYTNGYKFYGA